MFKTIALAVALSATTLWLAPGAQAGPKSAGGLNDPVSTMDLGSGR